MFKLGAQKSRTIVKTQVRNFQQFGGTYKSGFERMLVDKLSWF